MSWQTVDRLIDPVVDWLIDSFIHLFIHSSSLVCSEYMVHAFLLDFVVVVVVVVDVLSPFTGQLSSIVSYRIVSYHTVKSCRPPSKKNWIVFHRLVVV